MTFENMYKTYTGATFTIIFLLVFLEVYLHKKRPHNENLYNYSTSPYISTQSQEYIVNVIRTNYIIPPTNPDNNKFDSGAPSSIIKESVETKEKTLSEVVIQSLNFKKHGFFVECGASNGTDNSNTLSLENQYNWTGLLIEMDPEKFKELKESKRHAFLANFCLSPKLYPMNVRLTSSYFKAKYGKRRSRHITVHCFPFEMVMMALNRTEVNYLALNTGGLELDILETIPFEDLKIEAISVETRRVYRRPIRKFLESVGYRRVKTSNPKRFKAQDLYLLRRDYAS